ISAGHEGCRSNGSAEGTEDMTAQGGDRWPSKKGWAISLGLVLLALLLAGCQTRLSGTELDQAPAQDFRLTDQFGNQVALSDFRGRPVVLTFLYTTCPDVCPLIAERLRLTANALGDDVSRVGILAVSTDPRNDDVAA